jgi:hypothetical protein
MPGEITDPLTHALEPIALRSPILRCPHGRSLSSGDGLKLATHVLRHLAVQDSRVITLDDKLRILTIQALLGATTVGRL